MSLMFDVFPCKCAQKSRVYVEEETVYVGDTMLKFAKPVLTPSDSVMAATDRCFRALRPSQLHRMHVSDDGKTLEMDTVHGKYTLVYVPLPNGCRAWESDDAKVKRLSEECDEVEEENRELKREIRVLLRAKHALDGENKILAENLEATETERVALETKLIVAGCADLERCVRRRGV